MVPIKTILHPTDFSACSANALALAGSLAADYGANLVIVHVISAPLVLSDGVIFGHAERDPADIREELNHLEVPDDGIGVTRRLEEGNPAAEIVSLAQVCHADLIVMGSHGRRGLRRWLMGSVAEAVMRQASCPVLTVTAPVGQLEQSLHRDHMPTARF